MLSLIGIAPHPAIIIPEIGRNELDKVSDTVSGMRKLSMLFKEESPDLLIVITPHGSVFREGPSILVGKKLNGNFGQFGFPSIQVDFETDRELLELVEQETADGSLKPVFLESNSFLDHGAMVPLYYLNEAGLKVPGLHITFGFNPPRDLYRFGQALRRAIEKRGLKTAVLASGDLSHRLIHGAPAGFNPRGAEYDRLLIDLLGSGKVEEIIDLDPRLIEEAGECGYRSFVIALGTIDGEKFETDILSYEGPFGVGYLVAAVKPMSEEKESGINPAKLARKVLEQYFSGGGKGLECPGRGQLFQEKAGAFVSLKKDGKLRGCIGTVEPVRQNLYEEIKANAVSAAVRDPRFSPVETDELKDIAISVDVLSPMEKVSGLNDLNPEKYGVLVRSGHLSGLLLPDLEGIDTPETQVSIAMQKAGISSDQPVELYRFTVTRYRE